MSFAEFEITLMEGWDFIIYNIIIPLLFILTLPLWVVPFLVGLVLRKRLTKTTFTPPKR